MFVVRNYDFRSQGTRKSLRVKDSVKSLRSGRHSIEEIIRAELGVHLARVTT